MSGLSTWDAVVLGCAGYLAVTLLVRLMVRRRNRLIEQLGDQVNHASRASVADNNSRAA